MPAFCVMNAVSYMGRFAPSPTGPLHFGSLVAAVGSYADALSQGGRWLVRMEDVDEGRRRPGADAAILRSLERHGFEWHGEVLYQSRRKAAYGDILADLQRRGLVYPCGCTRRQIQAEGRPGPEGVIYAGTCRNGLPPGRTARALRLKVPDCEFCFDDLVYGHLCQNLARAVGDFVVRRADGFTAYQLAVVADDAWQGITRVVRGADLLMSTPRQIYIQTLLGAPQPEYLHLPLVVDAQGRKLSKRDGDQPLDDHRPLVGLLAAWRFLDQPEPPEPLATPAEFWAWAARHWSPARIRPRGRPA